MSELVITNEGNKTDKLLSELKRLVEAGKAGDFNVVLDGEGLPREEAEIVRLLNEATNNYRNSMEYDLMKYRLTSDALNIALWDMDMVSGDPINPNNKITWSQEFRYMLGFSDEHDFPNLLYSWSDRLHPEDKERTINVFLAHVNDRTGRTPYDVEYRLMLKNGEYRYFHAFGAALRDSAGVSLRVAGALMDIAEKKRMEEALKEALNESNKTLDNMISILNKSDAMIHVTDPNTNEILFMTDYMKQHYGIVDDVIGQHCYKVIRGRNEKCDFCPCYQLDKEPDKAVVWEERNALTQCYYRNVDRYVDWPGGKKVHIQFATDLTDIKQAQETLERREKMLRALNEMAVMLLSHENETLDDVMSGGLSPISSVGVDRIGVYRLLNGSSRLGRIYLWHGKTVPLDEELRMVPDIPPIARWLEVLTKGECINANVSEMPKDEAAFLRALGVKSVFFVPIFTRGEFWGIITLENCTEYRYFDEDFLDLLRSAAHLCASAIVCAEMEHDLREKNELNKKMVEEIKNALFEVQEANRAKNEFLSRMSHEMLTPMNAIMGMTQIAKMSDSLDKANEYLDQIDESSRHLLRLINDLLDISGKKDSVFRLVDSDFSFKGVIRNVLKDINRDLNKKQQALTFDIDQSIPASLTGDENRLAQVIANLLTNSIKFTHEHGEIHFSARVIEEDNETVTLQIEVADNGIGIPKDKQSEIFSIFEQADGNLSRKHGGAGLGLPLSERIVEMMGGKIWVDSEPDKGSKFMFTCKLKK